MEQDSLLVYGCDFSTQKKFHNVRGSCEDEEQVEKPVFWSAPQADRSHF